MIFKAAVAEVEVERVCVSGEVGLDEVEQAVAVEVADRNAHARLGFAVGRESDARFDGDVFEGPVFLILVIRSSGGVVGDVDVGPAVIVKIGDRDAEAIGADGVEDAGLFRYVGEGSIAVVVVEDVLAALQAGRPAGDLDAFVGACAGLGKRRGLDIEVDVVGDEEIEVAVAIVVEEGAA